MQDPTLTHAIEQNVIINGVPLESGSNEQWPHFAVNNDLIYWVTKVKEDIVKQLLVLLPHREKVLHLAPNNIGGHRDTNCQPFYWPGL